MNEWTVAASLIGISVLVATVLLVFCRVLGGWTWIYAWITGNKEETTQLTKGSQYAANGYMMNSESDIALDISGDYKHYDTLGNDVKFVQEMKQNEACNQQHVQQRQNLEQTEKNPLATSNELNENSPDCDLTDSLLLETTGGATLRRAVSCESVCSDTSVMLEALDSPHHAGELEVGLEYDNETEDLIILVNRARDLVGLDPHNSVDSYVRVVLLPDRSTNMQTRVQRRKNNPVFKERFLFGVDRKELPQRSVLCTVYTCDKYTNTVVGEAEIRLSDVDLRYPLVSWVPIIDANQGPADLGDIMFSLSYLPTAERLTVVVVKARNLTMSNNAQTGDPFVKVYLLQSGKKTAKKKTTIKKGEVNPIFNEAMIFSVPAHALQNVQLRLTVAENQQGGNTPVIGHVFVGPMCKGKSLSHWNQMMSFLRKPVAMWHPLRKATD